MTAAVRRHPTPRLDAVLPDASLTDVALPAPSLIDAPAPGPTDSVVGAG